MIYGKVEIFKRNFHKNIIYTGFVEILSDGLVRIITAFKTDDQPNGEKMIFRMSQIEQITELPNRIDNDDNGIFD